MTRTIVVGDVHGCARELGDLLERIDISDGERLLLVGDVVVRGPDPVGVLHMLRSLDGRAVRGNHERRLLRWRELHEGKKPRDEADRRIYESKPLARTAKALDDGDWAYLEAMPLWIDEPAHELRVVHAGLDPSLPIEEQSERVLLYCRTLDERGRPSEERDTGVPWGARYQGPPHVVFGHNALHEPQLHRWATGIDTGCVYGGRLTALVLDENEPVPAAPTLRKLVSVPAHEAYFTP